MSLPAVYSKAVFFFPILNNLQSGKGLQEEKGRKGEMERGREQKHLLSSEETIYASPTDTVKTWVIGAIVPLADASETEK